MHIANGARMVPFAGFSMPVQYRSILEEHRAVRETAGLFDVSHMGELLVSGPDARDFLDYIITNDIRRIDTGQALYSPVCYENGGVVDDLIVYQRGPREFLLCVNAANIDKDFDWASQQSRAFDVTIRNVSHEWGQLALQGPRAIDILNTFAAEDFSSIARDGTPVTDAAGRPVGRVLLGTLSPMLNAPIGSALVERPLAHSNQQLFVQIRNQSLPITPARPPLFPAAT